MNAQQYEEAQWLMLKNLWSRYGAIACVLVVLVSAVIIGNAYWHTRQENRRLQASAQYEQLLFAVNKEDFPRAEGYSQALMTRYTDTPYAALAGLLLARQAVQAGHLDLAQQQLHWVVLHSQGPVHSIAQMRYARVLMAMHKPDEAKHVLDKVDSIVFQPMVKDIRNHRLFIELQEG